MLKACHCLCTMSSEEKERLREEKKNRKRSLAIDKELKKSEAIYKNTIKILLKGDYDSGKSTIQNQMRIIHISKFSEQERLEKVKDIKSNIRDSILSILKAMERLQIAFDDPSLVAAREYVYDNIDLIFTEHSSPTQTQNQKSDVTGSIHRLNHLVNNNEYNNNVITTTESSANLKSSVSSVVLTNQKIEKLWDCIEELWKDGGVKRCARRGDEYRLIDNSAYFLDRIEAIRSPKYLPDEQDILRCHIGTTNTTISETRFQLKKMYFSISEETQYYYLPPKWKHFLREMTAITYVVDISLFNRTFQYFSESNNQLEVSLQSFRWIWINRYLYHISIILFLNKYDIFVKKIVEEQCKLEDYYPDYKKYQQPTHIEKHLVVSDEHPEVTRAKMFILEQFINITLEENLNGKLCIPYFTCAIDTDNIKCAFNACSDILIKKHLERT